MVLCVRLPRFELAIAAADRLPAGAALASPLAIAPSPGGPRQVGEVSGAAEAHGIVVGMALGEALARCPSLALLPADPLGVAERWETTLQALEGIGAAVESPAPGLAFFRVDGLLGLYGGELGKVIAAAQRACRDASEVSARIGAGPVRFCALAAALSSKARRTSIVLEQRGARRWLSTQPVDLLRFDERTQMLVDPLRRFGLRCLGEVVALGSDALADRFGAPGVLAHRLACGQDTPLAPRVAGERLEESLELSQADSGPALERIMGVLVDRLLASPMRRGRTLRAVTVGARLVEGGTWRERVVFREAIADGRRMRLALAPSLTLLPAPAESLRLFVDCFGPGEGDQVELLDGGAQQKHRRLREALGQARAAVGPDAALRAVLVDVDSNVPERRCALAPFEV